MTLKKYFGFTKSPFSKAASDESIFKNAALESSLEKLHDALHRDTIAMVIAESGCGKSTLLWLFAKQLNAADHLVLCTSMTTLGPFSFLAHIEKALGLASKRFKGESAIALVQYFRSQSKRVVLLIDEAHLLPDSSLEDLRLLTTDHFDRATPFALVLVGQPMLRERMGEPQHHALFQRIGVRVRLRPLSEEEMSQFIICQLRAAGCKKQLFEPEGLAHLFHHSRGVCRLVQQMALDAMTIAMNANQKTIDAQAVEQAVNDWNQM